MNFFYDYGKGDNTNFFLLDVRLNKILALVKEHLALSQLSNFLSNMLSPLDQLVVSVANPANIA